MKMKKKIIEFTILLNKNIQNMKKYIKVKQKKMQKEMGKNSNMKKSLVIILLALEIV